MVRVPPILPLALIGLSPGCSSHTTEPLADTLAPHQLRLADGTVVSTTAHPDADATCLRERCADRADADAFATCARDCEPSPASWSVTPSRVRYDAEAGRVSIQAQVDHTPATLQGEPRPRTAEAYAGVTLITASGDEIDLAIDTLFPGEFSRELIFFADVGPGVRDLIFGLWDRKVEPCDDARPGCRDFGFLLDGSLAAWPPTTYTDGTRQRIPPGSLTLVPLWTGAEPEAFRARVATVQAHLDDALEPFGTDVARAPVRLGEPGPAALLYRDAHDAVLVGEAARASGLAAIHDPALDTDLALRLDGPPPEGPVLSCAQARCDGADDLLACIVQSCSP